MQNFIIELKPIVIPMQNQSKECMYSIKLKLKVFAGI